MSVGAMLSAAREEAGLSLQQVSDVTRLRRTVIERIEADDFSLCGGDVYARGHLRTIAKVVGTDPEPLLQAYEREQQHVPEPTAAEVFESESARPERRGPNWTAAMAAALVVVAGIGAYQLTRGGGTPTPTAGSPSISSTPTPTTSGSPSAAPTPSASRSAVAQVPPTTGVVVRLSVVSGKSWVSATEGTKNVFQGLVSAGTVKQFGNTKLVKLVIGNAGAVRLNVNGKDIGSAGGSGQVVRVSFGPGDPTAGG